MDWIDFRDRARKQSVLKTQNGSEHMANSHDIQTAMSKELQTTPLAINNALGHTVSEQTVTIGSKNTIFW